MSIYAPFLKELKDQRALERRLLDQTDIHSGEFHQRRSAWSSLRVGEDEKVERFARAYLAALEEKTVPQRADYIEVELRKAGFRITEELVKKSPEELMQRDHYKPLNPGAKVYMRIENTVFAFVVGSKALESGANLVGTHIDSPTLSGTIRGIKEDNNRCYLSLTCSYGSEPIDWVNQELELYLHGTIGKERTRKRVVKFTLGGDYGFIVPTGSLHLTNPETKPTQLDIILGTIPFPGHNVPGRSIKLNLLRRLNEQFGITEDSLQGTDIYAVPKHKPGFGGIDFSTINSYGQDNFSTAIPLLGAVKNLRHPEYTFITAFFEGEETGRMKKFVDYMENIVFPDIASLCTKDSNARYPMAGNLWSWFLDVIGPKPITENVPGTHDPRDSPFPGSGVVILQHSGDSGASDGYKPTPEFLSATRTFLERQYIPHQIALMGCRGKNTMGISDIFHPDEGHGVDIGICCDSMHRLSEQVYVIDGYSLAKALKRFANIGNHQTYMPLPASRSR